MSSDLVYVRSGVPGLTWPPMVNSANVRLLALVQWLDRSQWLDGSALQAAQQTQLAVLLKHFELQSPWVRDLLRQQGLSAESASRSWDAFARYPVTTRADVLQAGQELLARVVPPSHLPVTTRTTSGSTGVPVTAHRSAVNQLFWQATTLREHLWHQRDPKGRLAVIRQSVAKAFDHPNWGAPVANLFDTGTSHGMPVSTAPADLLQWLADIRPTYLLVYPGLWQTLLDLMGSPSGAPFRAALGSITQVRTLGQSVSDDLRQQTQTTLGIRIADTYSSEETGVIAIECPHSGLYHVMAEGLVVEVLAPDGSACQVGEIGRVVVTDLLNFASPVIRYDLGDYAQVGPPCACGRGLLTLAKILGRQRNMLKLPDGNRRWRLAGYPAFASVANITQYQLVQTSPTQMEVRLAVDGPALTTGQEAQLAAILHDTMPVPFEYRFVYPKGGLTMPASGKFEEFVCEC